MTTVDKLETMEALWEDLRKNADSLASPDWHKKILKDREQAIKEGKDTFLDWKEAKKKMIIKLRNIQKFYTN